jgi:cell division protein FtsB
MSISALDDRRPLPRTTTTEYATRGARARKGQGPGLRVVAPPRAERASRGLFALIIIMLLGGGFLANLLVNTSMAQGAFQIGDLQQAATKLSEEQAVLREQVGALSAPTALESKARALGMIPTDSPVFLSVPGGKVIGQPAPAGVAAEKKKDKKKNGRGAANAAPSESMTADAAPSESTTADAAPSESTTADAAPSESTP